MPAYNINDLSGSYIDQLGQFERIVLEANKNGIINNPPNNEVETYDLSSQRIRIQTIATRLWLLGYLPRRISPKSINKKLGDIKTAVHQFQRDANLKRDNWVGDKTWYALDQLVSYESDIDYNQWYINHQIRSEVKQAFHRAIQLRLWSLGLFRDKPRRNFELLSNRHLKNFSSILKIFRIKDESFEAELDHSSLEILFDQDLLSKTIAKRTSKDKKKFLLKLPVLKKEMHRTLAQKFIVNCAKIELWLLGYDVKIDGGNNFQFTVDSDLYRAISHYYHHFENLEKVDADSLAARISPKLFVGIGSTNEISTEYETEDLSAEIAKVITSDVDVKNAWSYIKDRGVRLWDGLKRMWRWIKKLGRKAVGYIKENVFIAFYRYSSKAYKILKKGITSIIDSIEIYVKGNLQVNNVLFQFSKDMDTLIYIPEATSIKDTELAIEQLKKQSKTFKIACQILGWIVHVFKNLASGFVGWAKLLISLVKGYPELRNLYLDFKEIGMTN